MLRLQEPYLSNKRVGRQVPPNFQAAMVVIFPCRADYGGEWIRLLEVTILDTVIEAVEISFRTLPPRR